MERTVEYTTDEEKRTALADANRIGETQIHDDWTVDDDANFVSGLLTFDIIVDIPENQDRIDLRALKPKIKNGTATLSEVQEYLTLRDNL